MSTGVQYEFTEQQNAEIKDLAGKMGFVGFFLAAFGLLALLICLVTVLFIFRDRLPSESRKWVTEYSEKTKEAMPEDVKKQLAALSSDNSLIGVAIFTGVTGLIFLLQGVWARSSAASFQKIVDTEGNDITNLMYAVNSLRSMYGQISMLLTLAILAGLIAIGYTVYKHFTGV
jgi:hypothetical protein